MRPIARSFYTRRLHASAIVAWLFGAFACPGARAQAGPAPALADDAAYDASVETLARAVEARPGNASLARAVAKRVAAVAADPAAAAAALRTRLVALGLTPCRVPGLFYVSRAWTGADLARVESWLERPVPLLATDEVGTVEENGRTLARALHEAHQAGQHLVVWSASKGSADLLAALAYDPGAARAITLWIDLVGLLDGTPLTDPAAPPAERAAIGLPEATARSMWSGVRAPALARVVWPPTLRVVHVAGFPSAATITQGARAGFERLRPLGPNDGWLLLAGLAQRQGPVVVLRGVDHYLATPALRAHQLALLDVVLGESAP